MKLSRMTVALGALCLLGGALATQASSSGGGTVQLTADFANASPLVKGNVVRASGVDVGTITGIELEDGQARVTLNVDRSILPLHTDAKATITTEDLLGERFVNLDRGSADAPELPSPYVLDEHHTARVVDLQDVLNSVDTPTSVALSALLTEAGEGLRGNGQNAARTIASLAPTMQQARRVVAILRDQNSVLGHLVDSAEPVAAALATRRGTQLDHLVNSATSALDATTTEREALGRAVSQLPATIAHARETLAQLARTTTPATRTLAALRPVTDQLRPISGELSRFSDAANPALTALNPVLTKGKELLDDAAPVVSALRPAARDLMPVSTSVRRISARALSGRNLTNLMEFVKGWSLATSDYDAVSHYFRAMVPLSPNALGDDVNALVPALPDGLLHGLPVPTAPSLPLPGIPGSGSDTSKGSASSPNGSTANGGGSTTSSSGSQTGSAGSTGGQSATGLSPKQENNLINQLLGGLL